MPRHSFRHTNKLKRIFQMKDNFILVVRGPQATKPKRVFVMFIPLPVANRQYRPTSLRRWIEKNTWLLSKACKNISRSASAVSFCVSRTTPSSFWRFFGLILSLNPLPVVGRFPFAGTDHTQSMARSRRQETLTEAPAKLIDKLTNLQV